MKSIKAILRRDPLTEQGASLLDFSWILLFGFGIFLCIMIFMYATNVTAEGGGFLVVFAVIPVAISLIFIKIYGSREEERSTLDEDV
ncbi:MAG TPA: hypothetical protein VJ695_10105 [Nitrososphaera sp.]|nr:hypothetical protein [Nitrososphaera sp.]